ncbi:hypothetical protein J6590_052019 [Homalodisca vitripennis]|nr:hypothetical protein J6590_052019 [Homalodisca vitripennis]
MEQTVEPYYAVALNLGKSTAETIELITQAYEDDALSRTKLSERHKKFKEGRELVRDHHVGPPMTTRSNAQVATVWTLDSRLTIAFISKETGLTARTVHNIITEDRDEGSVRKTGAESHKEENLSHVEISQENLDCTQEGEGFLDKFIAGVETWVFQTFSCFRK